MESMLEISMLELTRGLTGFPHHLLGDDITLAIA